MNRVKAFIIFTLGISIAYVATAQVPEFRYKMSRPQLEWYLSRAITMDQLVNESKCYYPPCDGPGYYDTTQYKNDVQMLSRLGARFIGRVSSLWGGEGKINHGFFKAAAEVARDIDLVYREHDLPRPIIQAAIFEIVSKEVNGVMIPDYVAKAYGISPRHFRYKDMIYPGGYGLNRWSQGSSIPDMSRLDTQMWFYFLATEYIKRGYEAIHFGQVMIMDHNDSLHIHWWNVLSRIRKFAKKYNRGVVLCDAHTHGEYYKNTKQLLFDFHSAPIRPIDVKGSFRGGNNGGEEEIVPGVRDVIYNRSKGGKTYFGWSCTSLPYLVEFDNWGISDHPNKFNVGWAIWGWDEITWFGLQDEEYRKSWLKYAYHRVRSLDPNGYLEMPGLKGLTRVDAPWPDTFHANMGSSKHDYNIENTIKRLWEGKE